MTNAKTEPQIETVKMDDGRIVEFAGKRKLLKESFVSQEGEVSVRLDFRNGETRTFKIPTALMAKFAAHGAEQKLGDEIAGLKKQDGSEADIDDAVLAVDNLMERLEKGEWSTKREGSAMAGTSVLIQALVRKTGKTVAEVKQFLNGDESKGIPAKTQAEKMALRNNPAIKPIVEQIEAEKAANSKGKIDSDKLLEGLDGLGDAADAVTQPA